MNRRFEECIDRVLAHEDALWLAYAHLVRERGVDHPETLAALRRLDAKTHPADPGGATRLGVTLETFRRWRGNPSATVDDLNAATIDEIKAIYHARFWNVVRADDLPPGVDYAVFDFAVNSGPGRAARFLQRIVGAAQDGAVGRETLAAARGMDRADVINRMSEARLDFLRSLSTFPTFGRGWTRRVEAVRQAALQDAEARMPVAEVVQTDTARGAGFVAGLMTLAAAVVEALRQALPLLEGLPQTVAIVAAAAVAVGVVVSWRAGRP